MSATRTGWAGRVPALIAPYRAGATAIAGAALFLYTIDRGLDRMTGYPYVHWLLTYDHGFIKRGLVGTVVAPLLLGKSPEDAHLVIVTLTAAILTLLLAGWARAAWAIGRSAERVDNGWFLPAAALAFVGSSAVVFTASTVGFLDHVLGLLTLAGITAVHQRQPAIAAALAVAGLAVHELYALYGIPVIALALVLDQVRAAREGGRAPTAGRALGGAAAWLVPAAAFLGWVVYSEATLSSRTIAGIRKGLLADGVDDITAGFGVFHLSHGFQSNLAAQQGYVLAHLFDAHVDRVAWPILATLTVSAAVLVRSSAPPWAIALLLAAVLAPLAIHLFAWDATRFTHFAVLQAFGALYAAALFAQPTSVSRPVAVALTALAAASLAASLAFPVPLLNNQAEGTTLFTPAWPDGAAPPRGPSHR